jgi:aspartyl-tRNA(Asn)/glutamyl-tRNA(Gln) amidotransferase subunit A
MDYRNLTLHEAARGLAAKEWSAAELAEAALAAAEAEHGTVHGFVQTFPESAREQAAAADARRAAGGARSEFDGVPLALKDNLCVAGRPLSCGSAILRDYVAPYDSTAAARLLAAGAVLTGRTNMDEFAMGSSTESSVHGVTRNPWDLTRIPGGSSGGSAAAVASGAAIAALGSDTGGSIRQPAAMCGVVGLKPTYGRVSRHGLAAMASSFDQVGPIAKTVADAAALLRLIEGADGKDATAAALKPEWALPAMLAGDLKGVRLGVPKECFGDGLEAGVAERVKAALARFEDLGASIKEVSLPRLEESLAVYYVIVPSEVSANLARLDGIRYGARQPGGSLEEVYRQSRGRGFGAEVRRRILIGTYALSSGYYDAYYKKALAVRRVVADDFAAALADVDALVTPTSPVAAWRFGEKVDDPLAMYLADIYTVGVNVAGLPGLSLPCGQADGLPVGLQLIGRPFAEATILNIAQGYETAAGAGPRPGRG